MSNSSESAHEPTRLRAPQPQAERPGADVAVGVGRVLNGKYRLQRVLGSGGMGVVYLAEDLIGTEPVAIKVLQAELQSYPDIMDALREEVTQTRKLRHENIVGVYALEQDGADPYIVMEYLTGNTLRGLLDQEFARGLPLSRARPIIAGIGAALAFAHDHGIIHSDLKPENIFLTAGGIPKVLDFGIARAVRSPAGRARPAAPYTPAYASCELIEGCPPDFGDDVYGFACVVYELLTGRRPFEDLESTQARDRGLSPGPVPALSAAQNAVLRRGLAFQRTTRIRSVEELEKGLEPRAAGFRTGIIAGAAVAMTVAGLGIWWSMRHASTAPGDPRPASGGAALHAERRTADRNSWTAGANFADCAADCPSMIVIPPGKFMMGSPPDEPGRRADEKAREVVFAHAFALSARPVTRGEFHTFMTDSRYVPAAKCENLGNRPQATELSFAAPGFAQTDTDPAVCVSVTDARAYAAWLNGKVDAQVYRLPSEAEWEYAARAGLRLAVPWDADDSAACRFGNFGDQSFFNSDYTRKSASPCDDGFAATSPVGSFPHNPWGLYDMLGNVFEWTESCNQQLDASNGDAFLTDCQKYRVVRGAGFSSDLGGNYVRFARRTIPPPGMQAANTWGFRVARSL